MTYRPPPILSPIPIVKHNTRGACSLCDREWVRVWEHSNYPGMTVCEHCIDDLGDHMPSGITDLRTCYDMWEAAATIQGREIVPRV